MSEAVPRDSGPASNATVNSLSDENWSEIAPLLPAPSVLGRRRSTDPRKVVAAIEYQWRTGCPWRKLPPEFQPWPTIYGYVSAWRRDGTLRKLRPLLDPRQRERLRRCEEPLSARLNPFSVSIGDSLPPRGASVFDLNRQDHEEHKGRRMF
jgi:transposase